MQERGNWHNERRREAFENIIKFVELWLYEHIDFENYDHKSDVEDLYTDDHMCNIILGWKISSSCR